MKQIAAAVVAILVVALYSTQSVAEEYDYEFGVSYGNSSTDVEWPEAWVGGSPFGSVASSGDSDSLELSGTWYYSSLSEIGGPKSRAAFLGRASSLSVNYSYSDESRSFSTSGLSGPSLPPSLSPTPPWTFSADDQSDELEVSLRHVWQSSGWYGLAGAKDFSGLTEFDGNAYFVGVGKYLGQSTALDVKVLSSDILDFGSTGYALSLSHVGSIGSEWQYAADLGYSYSDSDVIGNDGSYSARLSLFPTTSLEFGVQAVHRNYEYSPDFDSYEAFVGWFVRDNIEVRARYGEDDFDPAFLTDFESNQFSIGFNMRF